MTSVPYGNTHVEIYDGPAARYIPVNLAFLDRLDEKRRQKEMNPDAPGYPVRSMHSAAKLNAQLKRISEDHGVVHTLKKIGGTVRVVVGAGNFPCERVDVWRRPRFGTYLEVDGKRVTG